MISIMMPMHNQPNRIKKLLYCMVWLVIWQLFAMVLNQQLLFPTPVKVVQSFFSLAFTAAFWQAGINTALHILTGFILGFAAGAAMAAAGSRWKLVRHLADPPMTAIRAVPVASFIILVLLWVPSRNLSVAISFLMVLPVSYTQLLQGLDSMDPKLAEMGDLFRVKGFRRLRYLTLPQLMPWLLSGCENAIGLAWKSGVAAEVIGLPGGTIGELLYQAKLYLQTGELFAWTIFIVLLSAGFEKLLKKALLILERRLCR